MVSKGYVRTKTFSISHFSLENGDFKLEVQLDDQRLRCWGVAASWPITGWDVQSYFELEYTNENRQK
jgi:hypothetical protein